MPTTIMDIARIANVSHSTVSRALNGSTLVSEKTRKRVKEIAAQLNYVPNTAAQNLVAKHSGSILLLASSAIDAYPASFLYEIMAGVNQCIPESTALIFRKADEYAAKELSAARMHYDGILFIYLSGADVELIMQLAQCDCPLVVINHDTSDIGISCAYANEYVGVQKGIEYLLGLGHERIAHIYGPSSIEATYLRRSAFVNTLRQHDREILPAYVEAGCFTPEGGYTATQKLMALPVPPTAIFAANDLTAVGVLKACAAMGIAVPGRLSVLGFDDMEFSQYLIPSLTTIQKKKIDLGRAGAELLLRFLREGVRPPVYRKMELGLVRRATCAAAPSA